MVRGVNKVILLGHLGGDPEVRYTQGGDAVATISIATSETWTDKQTGEKREATEWHRVVFFRKLAEIVGQYLTKGSKVYVEGSLKTRKWQDQQGQDRYTTEIRADEMQMLDSKDNTGNASGNFQNGNNQPNGQQMNRGGYQQQAQQPQIQQPQQYGNGQPQPQRNQRPPANNGYAQAQNQPQQMQQPDFDDDIPFNQVPDLSGH